jgi:hypothetical protein
MMLPQMVMRASMLQTDDEIGILAVVDQAVDDSVRPFGCRWKESRSASVHDLFLEVEGLRTIISRLKAQERAVFGWLQPDGQTIGNKDQQRSQPHAFPKSKEKER